MTKESSSKDSDSTAIIKPMDVVNVLPIFPLPEIQPYSSTNVIVKTANIPIIETNEWPVTRPNIERQTKEIHGNSKIKGFCSFSTFITFVKPTRNNKENGIDKYPNSIWLIWLTLRFPNIIMINDALIWPTNNQILDNLRFWVSLVVITIKVKPINKVKYNKFTPPDYLSNAAT